MFQLINQAKTRKLDRPFTGDLYYEDKNGEERQKRSIHSIVFFCVYVFLFYAPFNPVLVEDENDYQLR